MDHVKIINDIFWGNSAYLTIFVLSMILIFYFRKKWENAYKAFFPYVCLLYILVLFNPILIKKLLSTYFPGDAELVRLYIILPVGLVISFVLSSTVSKGSGKKKILVLSLFLAMIVFSGRGILETDYYIKPESIYKINNDGREAAIIMEEDVKKDISSGQVKADRYDKNGKYVNTYTPVYLEARGPELYKTTRLVMTEYTDGYNIKGKFERGGSYFFGIMCYADWRYIQAASSFISDEEYITDSEYNHYSDDWLGTYYLPKFKEYTYITFKIDSGTLRDGIEKTGLYHEIGETTNGYVVFKKTKLVDTSK